jgi:hypothetical protein
MAQFTVRRLAGLCSLALCSRGPVWRGGTSPAIRQAAIGRLRATLPMRWPRVCLVSPDDPDPAAAGLAGRHRMVTGYATVTLDLRPDPAGLRESLHGKWRNRLATAEKSPLRVQIMGTKPAQVQWLIDRDQAQQQHRGYQSLPADFVPTWQAVADEPRDTMMGLRADLGRDAAAAMLFLLHGRSATYYIGWSDDAGREHGAHNLLLWQAMLALRERGIEALDLGGIDTQRGAGIARFKIGSGGRVETFSGTWLA